MSMKRYTIKNPGVADTYRCPVRDGQEVSVKNAFDILSVFGSLVDRLGRYEDTGLEPEEIIEIKRTHKIK